MKKNHNNYPINTILFVHNAFLILLVLLPQACEIEESDTEKRQKQDDQKINAYITDNNISAIKHSSGIYYEKLVENTYNSQVNHENIAFIRYRFSILDGDSLNVTNDTIVAFEQGTYSLIPYGLDIGCGLMHKGDIFRFYIPSLLAFGSYSNNNYNLQPYSILICELEVIDLQNKNYRFLVETDSIISYIEKNNIDSIEKQPSGFYFKKLITANSGNQPINGNTVKIHFERRYLDGTIHFSTLKNNPVRFRIGYNGAVKGLEEGIKLMKPNETALIIMPSELAFGSSIQVVPHELRDALILNKQISNKPEPFSPIVYKVKLLAIY